MADYSIDQFLYDLEYRRNTIIKLKHKNLYSRWLNQRMINELIQMKKEIDKLIFDLNYKYGGE